MVAGFIADIQKNVKFELANIIESLLITVKFFPIETLFLGDCTVPILWYMKWRFDFWCSFFWSWLQISWQICLNIIYLLPIHILKALFFNSKELILNWEERALLYVHFIIVLIKCMSFHCVCWKSAISMDDKIDTCTWGKVSFSGIGLDSF